MVISERLEAVCELVPRGDVIADVGTDHGYVPIILVQRGIARSALALDINRGPLERAKENINRLNLGDRIETRFSDGLSALKKGEADTIIMAGMGGILAIKILEEGRHIVKEASTVIIQPQSKVALVRACLLSMGLRIQDESMVEEKEIFYPVIRAVHGSEEAYSEEELLYGRRLLRKKNKILFKYLLKELRIRDKILCYMDDNQNLICVDRQNELRREISVINKGLEYFGERRRDE